jgi:hypothetical protein
VTFLWTVFTFSLLMCLSNNTFLLFAAKSKMWFRFRAGRITASKMKEVCRTHLVKPSESLIKSVCYPGENKFTNAATQWGCDHEKSVINEYLHQIPSNRFL